MYVNYKMKSFKDILKTNEYLALFLTDNYVPDDKGIKQIALLFSSQYSNYIFGKSLKCSKCKTVAGYHIKESLM